MKGAEPPTPAYIRAAIELNRAWWSHASMGQAPEYLAELDRVIVPRLAQYEEPHSLDAESLDEVARDELLDLIEQASRAA